MAQCSASELLEAGKCFACLTKKQLQIAIAQLLCEINEGGGGVGGTGEILRYTTTGPTADGIVPSDLNHEAIAVKPDGSNFTWDSVNHVWDDV